jgi:hypothetical protein
VVDVGRMSPSGLFAMVDVSASVGSLLVVLIWSGTGYQNGSVSVVNWKPEYSKQKLFIDFSFFSCSKIVIFADSTMTDASLFYFFLIPFVFLICSGKNCW